jgi:hypothetical protein
MAGWIATLASVVYVVVLALLRAAARGDEQLADVDTEPEPSWDEDWLDVWPTDADELTDAEVERRFARLVGWVE